MINFVLLISRQGKVRLTKWYSPYTQKERTKRLGTKEGEKDIYRMARIRERKTRDINPNQMYQGWGRPTPDAFVRRIQETEIEEALKRMKSGKAMGPDGIPIEVIRELSGLILTRGPKLCNFVEWRGYKVVYRRYASLYFCMCVDADDNELEILEIIHHFVEILDRYFGSVCELDLIFNFHKAYYILDEILIAGELQESSKKNVARLIAAQDSLVEAAKEEASSISNIIAQATK
ncbi:hypothetical protein PR202_ga13695 [Eleusine coracana subsp. coracana]|uniref:Adaptor AP-1 19 kDa protein n=1 Tax=Eleusine coracana subsp. coracana TaxID=191504 RepID=A0AAV5CFI3_ELECO|nr:hypothetical protein PR202_ga13695 [Eleusine coracana subsp. coracana]